MKKKKNQRTLYVICVPKGSPYKSFDSDYQSWVRTILYFGFCSKSTVIWNILLKTCVEQRNSNLRISNLMTTFFSSLVINSSIFLLLHILPCEEGPLKMCWLTVAFKPGKD